MGSDNCLAISLYLKQCQHSSLTYICVDRLQCVQIKLHCILPGRFFYIFLYSVNTGWSTQFIGYLTPYSRNLNVFSFQALAIHLEICGKLFNNVTVEWESTCLSMCAHHNTRNVLLQPLGHDKQSPKGTNQVAPLPRKGQTIRKPSTNHRPKHDLSWYVYSYHVRIQVGYTASSSRPNVL